MIHRNKQASYNYTVRDEESNDQMVNKIARHLERKKWDLCCQTFGHLLSEYTNILSLTKDFDSNDKFESIADEINEAYKTADEGLDEFGKGSAHPGKSDTMDNVLPTPQTKNTFSKDEWSVSSGEGGEEKQE